MEFSVASVPRSQLDPSSFDAAIQSLQQRIDQLQMAMTEQQRLATLGMVTAVIAHEFNNILTPMISYTKYALGDKSDDALREKALQKALAGAERAANISKSLLGFARGDESKAADVKKAIAETLSCLSRDLGKDGITLTVAVDDGKENGHDGLWAAMNTGQLQQVLMNLIVNARSAMLGAGKKGVKRLTISAGRIRKGRSVEIRLVDTGPGIDPEVLPRIFEPFFSTKAREMEVDERADGHEGMPRGGTGLGLTICRELVQAAGGTIQVKSELGKGTEFVIELGAGEGTQAESN